MKVNKKYQQIKSQLCEALYVSKDKLKAKLKRYMKGDKEDSFYKRRLDRIMDIVYESGFEEDKPKKILGTADFFQKIELFMDYDKEDYSEQEIYKLIGEVFKAYYIAFLFTYMDEDEALHLPYIGKILINENKNYSSLHKKMVETLRVKLKLDTKVKDDMVRIKNGGKLTIINDILDSTEESLAKKI